MHRIEDKEDYLLVVLEEDFDYTMLRIMLQHVMKHPEFSKRNDIWLIKNYRAHLHLDELKLIVDYVIFLYPRDAERNKTALVIEPGLTEAIAELFLHAGRNRLPFEMKIFHRLEDARKWLGVSDSKVA